METTFMPKGWVIGTKKVTHRCGNILQELKWLFNSWDKRGEISSEKHAK